MTFQAVYKRHTPFALELMTYPIRNGNVKLQKVGDVIIYAYMTGSFSQIESVSLFLGGQEVSTWDAFYLTTLDPLFHSTHYGYLTDSFFLPIPIPQLPTKSLRFHEVELRVFPPVAVDLHVMFAFVDEDIPDSDMLIHTMSKQTIRPGVPFSLYGAVKYIASPDIKTDMFRIDRDYTVPPITMIVSQHTRSKNVSRTFSSITFPVGMRVVYATPTQTLFGFLQNGTFIRRTNSGITTTYPFKDVIKVIDENTILCIRTLYSANGTIQAQFTEDTIDGFLVSGRLVILCTTTSYYINGAKYTYAYQSTFFSSQILDDRYIVVYNTYNPIFIDVVNGTSTAIPPPGDFSFEITPVNNRDPRDTFEGSLGVYTSQEIEGVSVIRRGQDVIFTCSAPGYRTLVSDGKYLYIYSIASETAIRILDSVEVFDVYRTTFVYPFCLNMNSTENTGYRWFSGEDIRIERPGTLYSITYNILTIQNGMSCLRIN